MITIVAKNSIKQGKTEEFKLLAEKLINESRKESGCISYNLYEDSNNCNILTFIEEWENSEAINIHNNSEHFTSIVPKFGELKQSQSEVNLYKRV
ncbi:antibiotic biosynthesis monooxygenase [Clostridium tagluense]|uniref:putative quinol monooxygenase n=1 Tax=Clostridium tagluense TaxID=360422 RepID=UPI001CF37107|nr:putative quinol monooxygenase [Clostridium tagluense]MCB2313861.1 antibiotic biosynthesis monooxygenase [Clostridium tagluense]MCB2318658.1 antibiotic biosynthesis monooxygenase [Clostridium tagluense]MCB2323553.1 antibiotic biosynthesis monooxygenase [Clostridium tagluense]MCB2328422.1 antibiotic biosynthesis monooxygenase [Clostridium tagluense]MCB2333275.1 antibiotic biosynthesis monooxygenase [Clostridium tagluense]